MSPATRSTQWAGETLLGQVTWRPLGVILSLWAWFGWLTPWLAAVLPERRETPAPNGAFFILGAALLGHASAALVSRMNLARVTAGAVRLLVLLVVFAAAWWTYIGGPSADGSSQWQVAWAVILGLGYAWWRAERLSAGEALEPDSTLRRLLAGTMLSAAAFVLFPEATRAAA